jgi:hypothetical protein
MRFLAFVLLSCSMLLAWDGYSYEKGNYIEVESYDHKGVGEGPVEYYDYSDGQYKSGYLDMYSGGAGTITDDESGESFDVEMEK